jgi:FAD/FMN-containing dehydrogenase
MPFRSEASHYVLLEVEGADDDALTDWLEGLLERDLVMDGTLAQNRDQAKTLWELREGISESLSATGLPHKNDIALPIAGLEAFVSDFEELMAERYPTWEICLFGHIGDGNLHVNVMKPDDLDKDAFIAKTHEVDRHLFELVERHHGSISAEHGIGLLKKEWLGYTRSPEEVALMRALKRVLDPKGILNPGKVL